MPAFHRYVFPVALFLFAAAAAPGAMASEDILDEVIVTGTLRRQPLADVAGSVAVLDSRTLRDAGQQHFQDVLGLVPNLSWAAGTSRPRYFQIRGIGEREQYEGAPNPSVGFLIDDIDFSGLGMPATLFDLKQVEVLRGPQGTAYGANALAGLIVVRGNDPSEEAGYSLEATGGDYGTRALGFTATGPARVLDSAWRLAVQKYESDGFIQNAFLDRDDTNGREELTARLKWRAHAGEATTLDLALLHADLDNGYDAWAIDNSRTSLADEPGEDAQRATGGSLRLVNAAAGANTLTAIAGYVDSKSVNSFDADWGNDASWAPYTYEYFNRSDRRRRTASLEVRLASPDATPDSGGWLVGAYALRLSEKGRDAADGAWADPDFPEYDDSYVEELDSRYRATNLALFGQAGGELAARWRWSTGLRLEQRRARYRDGGTWQGQARDSDLRARDRMLGGQLSLNRDFGDSVTGYASLSRGYKAGGFNLGNVPEEARSFDPEYLWNLETGLKAHSPDGRGHAEVALFYQRRRDAQVRSGRQLTPGDPNTYVFSTINLPKGYSTGLEASLSYALNPRLLVGASLGLLRSRSGATVMQDDAGNLVTVPSRENAHAPQYTAALNATWRHPRGFFARADLTAVDDFYFDVPTDHDRKARGYALAHFKVGYERDNWGINAWLRNAFDRHHAIRGFYFENEPPDWEKKLYVQQGDPRQFGVTATVSF